MTQTALQKMSVGVVRKLHVASAPFGHDAVGAETVEREQLVVELQREPCALPGRAADSEDVGRRGGSDDDLSVLEVEDAKG